MIDFQVAEAVVAKGREAERAAAEAEKKDAEIEAWKKSPVGSGTPGAD